MAVSDAVDRDQRAERAEMNQMLYRDINKRMKRVDSGFTVDAPVGAWICECANHACAERLQMSAEEYEAIRDHGSRFFVAPCDEHVRPDVETVTETSNRYWVVEKIGHEGPLPLRT